MSSFMSVCRSNRRELEAVIAHMRSEARRHRREIQHPRVENEVLREAAHPLIHHAPARERFAFIDRLRDRFSVKRLCRVTITDRGSFYSWVRAQARRDERALDEQELTVRILETHLMATVWMCPLSVGDATERTSVGLGSTAPSGW